MIRAQGAGRKSFLDLCTPLSLAMRQGVYMKSRTRSRDMHIR